MVAAQLEIMLLFWQGETSKLGEWERVAESLFQSPHCFDTCNNGWPSISKAGNVIFAKGFEAGIQSPILLLGQEFLEKESIVYSFLKSTHSYHTICIFLSCNKSYSVVQF